MRDKVASTVFEKQPWLDAPATAVQSVVDKAYAALGPAKEPVHQALNGDWMGHPLHPAVVIAPLGAFSTAVALDALDAKNGEDQYADAADAALAIGLITSIPAALTGATQWHQMRNNDLKRVGLVHAASNSVALGLMGASLLLRKAKKRKAGKALAAIGMTVLTFSGYLGGHMTYSRRAGVK
jgi:uncharacterized membrane protein